MTDLYDGWIPVETAIADMPAAIADLHDKARAAGRDEVLPFLDKYAEIARQLA